jgi:hypothetical protein
MSSSVPPERFRTEALPAPTQAPPAEPPVSWVSCPTCWGQRRLLEQTADGAGLVPVTCPDCLGIGERPVLG